jgi:hypothetical protein
MSSFLCKASFVPRVVILFFFSLVYSIYFLPTFHDLTFSTIDYIYFQARAFYGFQIAIENIHSGIA